MTTQFEFRLIDGTAPEGELEADQLIALVQSLKEVATKLGRAETAAETVGRPTKRTQRVATFTIGLAPGSTRLRARRTDDEETLEFDLDEEKGFDERFQSIVESIATDERPAWVTNTLAVAAGELRNALEKAAPTVEFTVDGRVRSTFETSKTHKDTWRTVEAEPEREPVTFVGRLRAVNLDTHRPQVTDDVGNKVALPNVATDSDAGRLLGRYVVVVGTPELDSKGHLVQIHQAAIDAAEPLPDTAGVRETVSVESLLAGNSGPQLGGVTGLTADEADSFVKAMEL